MPDAKYNLSMSVSRKAVNRRVLPMLDKIARVNKMTTTIGPIKDFNDWLRRFETQEERNIVYLTTMGVVEDVERRIRNLKELLKKEVFRKGG